MGKKQEYKLKNEEYLRELSQKEGIKKLPNPSLTGKIIFHKFSGCFV